MSSDEESEKKKRKRRRQRKRAKRKNKRNDSDDDDEPEVENSEGGDQMDSSSDRKRSKSPRSNRRRRRRKKKNDENDENEEEEEEEGNEKKEKKRVKKRKGRKKNKKDSSDNENEDEDENNVKHYDTNVSATANSTGGLIDNLAFGILKLVTKKFRVPNPNPTGADLNGDFSHSNPVLAVQVHGTDQLVQDPYVSHPIVKLHVVDATTGAYLKKNDSSIPSVNAVERQTKIILQNDQMHRTSGQCEYVMPMMTMPCDLGLEGRHGAALKFNELDGRLLFGESYTETILKPKTLFLFEILDFVPGAPKAKLKDGKGWYRVAWGFLHAVSSQSSTANISKSDKAAPKRLRLQLFKYVDQTLANHALQKKWWSNHLRLGGLVPDVYFSYLSQTRIMYPSTLYVSVVGVRAPKKDRVYRRAMLPMEIERHRLGFAEAIAAGEVEQEVKAFGQELDENTKRVLRRSRGEGEACLVPDTVASRIPTKRGCFGLSFSHSGKFLAASCKDDLMYPVSIYEVDTGKPWSFGDFLGHHEIVYTLRWMKGDKMLATASGDGTVKLWAIPATAWEDPQDLKKKKDSDDELGGGEIDDGGMTPRTAQRTAAAEASAQVVTLVHSPPCYVYSAVFHPHADPPVVLSCAFDGNIRLWNATPSDQYHGKVDARLYGKLREGFHKTRINCLTFDNRGLKLISADAQGVVIVWRCHGDLTEPSSYTLLKKLDVVEKMPIHSIDFCREHLLIHAEQNIIRIVELKRYKLIHGGFTGVRSGMANIGSCFSADGRWVIAGSEEGHAFIWYTRSTASYKNELVTHRFGGSLCGVAWHKSQHVVAMCSYEDGAPILLLEADRDKVDAGKQELGDALPVQSLMTKDGELDETAIFDGVELNEEQRQMVEDKRNKRRENFAKSLRSSLGKSNPRLKNIFDETVGRGSRKFPGSGKEEKDDQLNEDEEEDDGNRKTRRRRREDNESMDESADEDKGGLISRVAKQRQRKAARERAKRNESNTDED